jgi:6-phosphogluconolactonase
VIINCSDPAAIAPAVAAKLLALTGEKPLRVALTGGTLGIAVIAELGKNPPSPGTISFVFGDERFVPLDHADRNEAQGLEVWPGLGETLLRYPDVDVNADADVALERARDKFSAILESWLDGQRFDVVILGMGPDGHVASLFPGVERVGDLVVAEPESPKPPSARLSLSYAAINGSSRVWFVVSGSAKATASACSYHQKCELPAARVRGEETLWFVDEAIAQAVAEN